MQPSEPTSDAASMRTPWRQMASVPAPVVTELRSAASSVGTKSMPVMSQRRKSSAVAASPLYGAIRRASSLNDARLE